MILRITELRPEDHVSLATIGKQFYELAGSAGSFSPDWFLGIWSKTLKSGMGSLWCFEHNAAVAGYLGAVLHPCLFSGRTMATEAFWFVLPEYRGYSGGARLFLEFMKWARSLDVDKVQSAHIADFMEAELGEFYLDQGFKKLESLYVKELK